MEENGDWEKICALWVGNWARRLKSSELSLPNPNGSRTREWLAYERTPQLFTSPKFARSNFPVFSKKLHCVSFRPRRLRIVTLATILIQTENSQTFQNSSEFLRIPQNSPDLELSGFFQFCQNFQFQNFSEVSRPRTLWFLVVFTSRALRILIPSLSVLPDQRFPAFPEIPFPEFLRSLQV